MTTQQTKPNAPYDHLLTRLVADSLFNSSTNTGFTSNSEYEAFCEYANDTADIYPEFDFQGLMGNNDIYAYLDLDNQSL